MQNTHRALYFHAKNTEKNSNQATELETFATVTQE